ncbi:MAG: CdaR family protein [Pseudomonadota bacterium]
MLFRPYRRGAAWYFLIGLVLCALAAVGCDPQIQETDLLIPLRFSSTPAGLAKTSSFPRSISIVVKGPAGLIRQASAANPTYLVDLYTDLAYDPANIVSFIEPGVYSIPVMEHRIGLPPGLAVIRVNPSYITVKLERELVKRLVIEVPYTGKPATGYVSLPATVDPPMAELRGPESLVAPVENLRTKPVDLADANEIFKKTIPLALDESAEISVTPPVVMVTVPIQEEITSRIFEDIGISRINAGGNVVVCPETIELTVKGPSNTLKKSSIRDQIDVYIDFKDLVPGVYVRRAVIKLPVGLILTGARPELFTVTLE